MNTWNKFHNWVSGQPNDYITLALILTAILGILIALFGPPEAKIILLAYWWFP